jgi:hypothetical protein
VVKQLETFQGKMVIVHYHQKNGLLFWQGNSKYLADQVKHVRYLQLG